MLGEPENAVMSGFIRHISTAVPETVYRQDFLRDVMLQQFDGKASTRSLVRRIYDASGIMRRHSVVEDFATTCKQPLFFNRAAAALPPTTAQRNEIYIKASRRLAAQVGESLLAQDAQVTANEITHVITVSCTGFFAPDPGYDLIRRLGLSSSVHRYHIGFMGCFAAFQALQMADAFCAAEPEAVVLLVCVELCSLHLHLDEQPDNLVAASVFADGAAGALVSAEAPSGTKSYRLDGFSTALSKTGEEDMAWTLGDYGFDMTLSRYVLGILATNLETSLKPLKPLVKNFSKVQHWAVHPGGRAILDKVEEGMHLEAVQLASSRYVLANYGNMSSPTILFVLEHLLELPMDTGSEQVVAMAFGPGITIESAALRKQGT